jgi:hypothetical protein
MTGELPYFAAQEHLADLERAANERRRRAWKERRRRPRAAVPRLRPRRARLA